MMEQEQKQNGKSFFKGKVGFLVLVVVAVLVVIGLLNFSDIVDAVHGKLEAWKYQRMVDKMTAPYKNDKYGGKTPEETFDLFIDALKKEDIDLASKYFVIPKQESWKKTLGEYKKQNILADLITELESNRKKWIKNTGSDHNVVEFNFTTKVVKESEASFGSQKLKIPAGNYTNTTQFQMYPSGIWKISLL